VLRILAYRHTGLDVQLVPIELGQLHQMLGKRHQSVELFRTPRIDLSFNWEDHEN
jgi:hypothetical protein